MNFEMYCTKSLLSKYLNDYLEDIEKMQINREKIDPIRSGYAIIHVSNIVYDHLICSGKSSDEAYEESNIENITKRLNASLKKSPYTEEELNHLYCYNGLDFDKIYLDIATKRFFMELYNSESIEQVINNIEEERKKLITIYEDENSLEPQDYNYIFETLNKKFETKDDVTRIVTQKFEDRFLKEFNCGGYALEVFDWVDCDDKNHDVTVDRVLLNPDVRLLGDTELKDDEYLVVLDATTYHFIKQKDDKWVEKMRVISYK